MVPDTSTDRAWKQWGALDPYYAVLSADEFRSARMDDAARARFFDSGRTDVEAALAFARAHLSPSFAPERSLDFGCGVGRTLLPLARCSREAVGVDISPAMLAEARRNCDAAGLANVLLVPSDARLSAVPGDFDLIHSLLVFHHIRPAQGLPLLAQLLAKLRPGGIAVLQFLYRHDLPAPLRAARWLQAHVPGVHAAVNVVRGRALGTPDMEGNVYPLARVFEQFEEAGVGQVVSRLSRHRASGYVTLFGRKS